MLSGAKFCVALDDAISLDSVNEFLEMLQLLKIFAQHPLMYLQICYMISNFQLLLLLLSVLCYQLWMCEKNLLSS